MKSKSDTSFFPERTIFPPVICDDMYGFIVRTVGRKLTAKQSEKLLALGTSSKERWKFSLYGYTVLCEGQWVGIVPPTEGAGFGQPEFKEKKLKPISPPILERFRSVYQRDFSPYMESYQNLRLQETPQGYASHYEPFAWAEVGICEDSITKLLGREPAPWQDNCMLVAADLMGFADGCGHDPSLTKTMGIGEDLFTALADTAPPVDLRDIQPPLPYGVLFFPKSVLGGEFSGYPCWTAFSFVSGTRDIPDLTSPLKSAWFTALERTEECLLKIIAPSNDGAAFVYTQPWGHRDAKSDLDDPKEAEYASLCFRVTLNFLAYLSALQGEDTPVSSCRSGFSVPGKGEKGSAGLRRLEMHGLTDSKRGAKVSAPHSSHVSPRAHWRRGHWRNQACGEGYQKRQLIWIRPVLIGAKSG